MNTDRLAKHYASLTPAERLPLLMAASARGAETEYAHLGRSAPKVHFEAPDTFYLAEALGLASMMHMIELLNRAAGFLAAFCRVSKGGDEGEEKARRDMVLLFAHRFVVTRDGWKRFASEFPFDPDWLLRVLPGYQTVRITEDALRELTPTREEAAAFTEAGFPTPESEAASWWEIVNARARQQRQSASH